MVQNVESQYCLEMGLVILQWYVRESTYALIKQKSPSKTLLCNDASSVVKHMVRIINSSIYCCTFVDIFQIIRILPQLLSSSCKCNGTRPFCQFYPCCSDITFLHMTRMSFRSMAVPPSWYNWGHISSWIAEEIRKLVALWWCSRYVRY